MTFVSSGKLSSSRIENSLFVLTRKFFHYLKQIYPNVIDTNELAHYLCVSKRRVYDITNIFEGLGLLRKKSVNTLEWIGDDFNNYLKDESVVTIDGCKLDEKENKRNSMDINLNVSAIEQLDREGEALDQKIAALNSQIQNTLQQESSIRNAYVTYSDLLNLPSLKNKLIFAVKAPNETFLENKDTSTEYVMEFNTSCDKIDVFYISDETERL